MIHPNSTRARPNHFQSELLELAHTLVPALNISALQIYGLTHEPTWAVLLVLAITPKLPQQPGCFHPCSYLVAGCHSSSRLRFFAFALLASCLGSLNLYNPLLEFLCTPETALPSGGGEHMGLKAKAVKRHQSFQQLALSHSAVVLV